MENKNTIPKWVIREAVTDCKDVHEFAYKYRKPDRFIGRGEENEQAIMKTHRDEIARLGYTIISQHDNITGRIVAFIPKTI